MSLKLIIVFRIISTFLCFNSIVFISCSVSPRVQNPQTSAIENPLLTAPLYIAGTIPEYKLGFGDVINIKFFRNTQFDETVIIRPDGRISLPKVGELLVSGMTPAQVDSIITKTYSEFVLEPDVTVIVRQFGNYQVYVLGEVNSPGSYPIKSDMTVLQALAVPGGPKDSAELSSVIVLRRSDKNIVEDIKIDKVDLNKSVHAKSRSDVTQNDILIQPKDIIFVPKTFIANISDFMRQVYTGFLPPLDLYLRAILFYDRK